MVPPDRPLAAVPVRFEGTLRGGAVRGEGTLAVFPDILELRAQAAGESAPVWAVPCSAVQEISSIGGIHQVKIARLGTLSLESDDARALDEAISMLLARCRTLPELTLALPGLGSSRAASDAAGEHDRFFAPLLDARRAAERARTPEQMLAALDARALARALEETLVAFARERNPARDSARRAMEALLEDGIAPLHAALEAQAQAAEAVRHAGDAGRLAPWREWTESVRRTFLRADECWRRVRALLVTPMPARRGWRP